MSAAYPKAGLDIECQLHFRYAICIYFLLIVCILLRMAWLAFCLFSPAGYNDAEEAAYFGALFKRI